MDEVKRNKIKFVYWRIKSPLHIRIQYRGTAAGKAGAVWKPTIITGNFRARSSIPPDKSKYNNLKQATTTLFHII
jgi:hypothetical protein